MNGGPTSVRPRRLGALLALVALMAASAGCNYDWAQLGYGPTHDGSTPETSITTVNVRSLVEAWTGATGGATSSPAVVGGRVFVGSGDGRVLAFSAPGTSGCTGTPGSCQPLWTAATGGPVSSSPAVVGGIVYAGSQDGSLYAFDAAGTTDCAGTPAVCQPLWTGTTGGALSSAPVVAGGTVFITSDDGNLYAFDADGATNCAGTPTVCQPLWTSTTRDTPITSPPAVADGKVYAGSTYGVLFTFDAAGTSGCDGTPRLCQPLWVSSTPGSGVTAAPALTGGLVLVSGSSRLYAFDARGVDGCAPGPIAPVCQARWSAPTDGTASAPAVAQGRVFVGASRGTVYAFPADDSADCAGVPSTCTPLWKGTLGGAISAQPSVAGGVLFVASTSGAVGAFDIDGEVGCATTCPPMWQTTAGDAVRSSPVISQGRLYFGSDDALLHAFRPTASTTAVPPTVPAPHAAVGNREITVRWQPAVRRDVPITGYVVQPYRDGVAQAPESAGPTATSMTFTGLDPTATYSFTVAVSISTGAGQPSPRSNSEVPDDALAPAAYQVDPAHDGHQSVGTLASSPTKLWTKTFDQRISFPVVANGRVFVKLDQSSTGGYGSRLYALDAATGDELWGPVDLGGSYVPNGLAYGDHKVYVQNDSGLLQAFDEATGAAVWSVQLPLGGGYEAPPTAYRGVVYTVARGAGRLFARDGQSGAALWSANVAASSGSAPTVGSDGVYPSYGCSSATGLDLLTGAKRWTFTSDCQGIGGGMTALHDGLLYIPDVHGSVILDAATGSQVGSHGSATVPAFDGALRFEMAGSLTAIDGTTGEALWTQAGDGTLGTPPIVIDGRVIVGGSSGTLYAFDERTGAQTWTDVVSAAPGPPIKLGAVTIAGMAAAEDRLYVSADDTLDAFG